MTTDFSHKKIAFGDFQTPHALSRAVCRIVKKYSDRPRTIIEPTCGSGSFIQAALDEIHDVESIFGYEINNEYIDISKNIFHKHKNVHIIHSDFFAIDWFSELRDKKETIVVLGNFPWVTNATQGTIQANNLPVKTNFLNFKGIDAITGKANFDISEWMLITLCEALKYKKSEIAVLIKTAVARKILVYLNRNLFIIKHASLYEIDSKKYFNASVSSCLFHVTLNGAAVSATTYSFFDSLESQTPSYISYENGQLVNGTKRYSQNNAISFAPGQKWRSGIKHDAAKVMEFKLVAGNLVNGFGETVSIEQDFLYPLMKGSDVANSKQKEQKFVLVPQRNVGGDTSSIKRIAPYTWEYLQRYADILAARKSIIYKKNPEFSIFGIGEYAFKDWKIAICSLYKRLSFTLIGPINGKPCFFDDTIYYISFDKKEEAEKALRVATSDKTREFLNSFIFWDDKRPIKTTILNKIRLDESPEPTLFSWSEHAAANIPAALAVLDRLDGQTAQ